MAIKTGLFGSLKIKSEQVKNIVLGSKFSKFSNSELEISAGNKSDMKINKRKKSPSGDEKECLLEDQDWKKQICFMNISLPRTPLYWISFKRNKSITK